MPFLMKISTIRYTKDGKRVASSIKGAKRITETSVKWYGVWKENGRVVARVPLSADKRSATAMMVDLDRKKEREGANLSDPFKADKLRPLADHLSAYIGDLTAKGRDAEYVRSTENTLNRATTQCGFKCLADFTGDKLDAFLNPYLSAGANR